MVGSGLFPEEFRLEKLSGQGDSLELPNGVVDREHFREALRPGADVQDTDPPAVP